MNELKKLTRDDFEDTIRPLLTMSVKYRILF